MNKPKTSSEVKKSILDNQKRKMKFLVAVSPILAGLGLVVFNTIKNPSQSALAKKIFSTTSLPNIKVDHLEGEFIEFYSNIYDETYESITAVDANGKKYDVSENRSNTIENVMNDTSTRGNEFYIAPYINKTGDTINILREHEAGSIKGLVEDLLRTD